MKAALILVGFWVGWTLSGLGGSADNSSTPEDSLGAQRPLSAATDAAAPVPAPLAGIEEVRFTNVHCVCGPHGASSDEWGCVPVVENAVADVHPKINVTFECFFDPSKYQQGELERVVHVFNACRARSYFPHSPHVFLFRLAGESRSYQSTCGDLRTAKTVADGHGPRGVRDEIVFLIVRWNNWVPFHNLFDHGLFQVWMGWLTVKKFVEESLGKSLLPNPGAHIVDDLSGWWTDPKPAVHELWLRLLQPSYFLWQLPLRSCSSYYVVGDLRASTSGYMKHRHNFPSRALLSYLRNMSLITNERLVAQYGDVPFSDKTPLMVEDRPVTNSFDAEQRSRGIQPHLRNELLAALEPVVGPHVVRRFYAELPLKVQYHYIRSSKVILTSEGSFMAFLFLSRPNTTWICVYNHTRPPREWMYSNWHAPGAVAFDWIRVVFYVIDHGNREPMRVLVERFFAPDKPFVPGVFYLGNISEVGTRIESHSH